MRRTVEYIIFFVVAVLLQSLMFDNLHLSSLVMPLYYVVCVVLLPVEIGRMWLLLLGALLGAVMDVMMGTPGLNTIATTAVAFIRPAAINLLMGKEVAHETIPYGRAIPLRSFILYAGVMAFVHHGLFYGFESLGSHLWHTCMRVVLSSVVTVVLVGLTARLFRRIVG
jgi:rod shape-determining protein MreD